MVPAHEARAPLAAIFDMDGLLVDSEPLWRETETAILRRLGVPVTPQRCAETRGMAVGEVCRYWFARHPWAGPTPAAVADEIVEVLATAFGTRLEPKPGAAGALSSARRRGVALALASSSPRRLIELCLRRFHWDDGVFAVVHSAQDEPAGKPDPAVFLTTATRLGVDPGRCVVFEDSPAGVAAAVSAGMTCVAVPEEQPSSLPAVGYEHAHRIVAALTAVDDGFWDSLGVPPAAGPGPPLDLTGVGEDRPRL